MIPPHRGTPSGGNETDAVHGNTVGVPVSGNRDDGGGTRGGVDIHTPPP